MQKYPRTKEGMARRRARANATFGRDFNPANGEEHTEKHLAEERKFGFRRTRTRVLKGGAE